ncbi:MAG TPA: right-handed parallel beta-helix repeat-containing protein, partial [Planctomycetota bacterium]|nr:right-handed parallel beta-helix repeat-containing protein [Planctomycetota bacterium]
GAWRLPARLRALACACALLVALAASGTAAAQTTLLDTGPGGNTTIGAPSFFNDNSGFQFLGGRFTLAQPATIATAQGWMSTCGGTLQCKIRANNGSNQPGSELFAASLPVTFTFAIGWTTFGGLNWSLPAGTYWLTFEPANGTTGTGSMPIGAANPLPAYSFFGNGNPAWFGLGANDKLGMRLFGPTPVTPILVPADHPTIQAAIDAALSGQVIEVSPGTYPEALDFSGKTITVRSASGAAVTAIDATGTGLPAVHVGAGSAAGTTLKGFTVRGGSALTGLGEGGGLLAQSATLAVQDCTFTGNTATSGGGAAVVFSAQVGFQGCDFRDNHATTAGGGAWVNGAVADFTGCTFSANDAAGSGGGLEVNTQATVTLTDCRVHRNVSAGSAGGVSVLGSTANATLTGCRIEENTAAAAGGIGVNGAQATLSGCEVLNNLATLASAVSGGGLQAQGSGTLLVSNSHFTGNRAENGAGALLIVYAGSATFSGCSFHQNVANVFGGGLAVTNGSAGTASGCSFSDNQGLIGGGVFAGGGTSLAIGGTSWCANAGGNTSGAFTDNGGNTVAATCTGWTDLGYALEGASGAPLFVGSGSLAGGQNGALALSNARASSPCLFVVGLAKTATPFKGGTLVPVPPLISLVLGTDGNGALTLPFAWPVGLPPGFSLYFQHAIQDATAVHGVSLSNAVQSEAP